MKQESDAEIRRSPLVYVIVEDEELRQSNNSKRSKIEISSDIIEEKMSSEENSKNLGN